MSIHINPAHNGLFRKEVGARKGHKLTEKQIQKGLHSRSAAERERANFAEVARHKFHHGGK